ncbi:MAG: hypothetical protein AABW67_03935 [Nanoarchaeota archaeon]
MKNKSILCSIVFCCCLIFAVGCKKQNPLKEFKDKEVSDFNFQVASWEQKKQQVFDAIGLSFDELFSWTKQKWLIETSPIYIIDKSGFRYPMDLERGIFPYQPVNSRHLDFCDPAMQYSWIVFLPVDVDMPDKLLDLQKKLFEWYFGTGVDKEPILSEKRNLKNLFSFTENFIPLSVWEKGKNSIKVKVVFPGYLSKDLAGWKMIDYQMSDIFVTNLSKNGRIVEFSARPCLISYPFLEKIENKYRLSEGRCVLYIKEN